MEIEDAIHTALLTMKEGFEGNLFIKLICYSIIYF